MRREAALNQRLSGTNWMKRQAEVCVCVCVCVCVRARMHACVCFKEQITTWKHDNN